MDLHTLILFALTEAAMALSPGPAVLLAMSYGSRHGIRGAAVGAAGIELGNLAWFVFSAAGLTTLLLASSTAFAVIKWAGAAYLLYLGVRLLFSRGNATDRSPSAAEAMDGRERPPSSTMPVPQGRLVAQGFLTQMSNPKAMIFFGALLPQFIDPAAPFAIQFLVLGVMTLAIDYSALILYGWLADRGARMASGPKLFRWFDRVAGAFLVGAGAKLAV